MQDLEAHPKTARLSPVHAFGLLALPDVILLGYLVCVWALVWRAAASAAQAWCARAVYVAAACVIVACVTARGARDSSPVVRGAVYRVVLIAVVVADYLMLRTLLPVIRPDSVDGVLLSADVFLFGVEPSLWLERFNTRPVVEWFSFFYFSYFAIAVGYAVAAVLVIRSRRATAEFAVGTSIVYCVGQLGYMAVPGHGPIVFLADRFAGPVDGGFFRDCVRRTVEAGSALKDIFPSLHTAAPVWFAAFAWRQARADARWRWPAVTTAVFALNIVVSTMLLRWHYAVDVLAGFALAGAAAALAPALVRWEARARASQGWADAWDFR